MLGKPPFRDLGNGRFHVEITGQERRLIHDLPAELMKQLDSGDDDGSIYRLFPPGYTDDLGKQVEFDRLMRDELQESHIHALRVMQDTSDATELDAHQLSLWMRAINELRLVLGTRLDFAEDVSEQDFPPGDPRAAAVNLYNYLSSLQVEIIEVLGEPELTLDDM